VNLADTVVINIPDYSYATVIAADDPPNTMYKPLLKNKPAGKFR
jgi:hypothetical protein